MKFDDMSVFDKIVFAAGDWIMSLPDVAWLAVAVAILYVVSFLRHVETNRRITALEKLVVDEFRVLHKHTGLTVQRSIELSREKDNGG